MSQFATKYFFSNFWFSDERGVRFDRVDKVIDHNLALDGQNDAVGESVGEHRQAKHFAVGHVGLRVRLENFTNLFEL